MSEDLPEAIARHREEAPDVLASGDASRIKRLYGQLGDDLRDSLGDGEVPLLSYRETADAVRTLLANTAGPHLDVGCGPHPLPSLELARDGRMVVGLDMSVGMLALALRKAEEAGVDFVGVVGDAENLPFRDGVFGSVVCDDTIEHLPDDRAGARELARVTRPEGAIALATPNRRRLPVLLARLRDRFRGRRRPPEAYYAVNSHLREYTWRELEDLVVEFADVTGRGHVPWPGRSWKSKLASAVTATRPGRALGRVVLLRLRPR